MKKIIIADELKNKVDTFHMGVVSFSCRIIENDSRLDDAITEVENKINNQYQLSEVLEIPNIKAARDGYKKLGKDPSRYRLAVESLFRRIVKGNTLYRINNVVDVGNLLSLQTMRSIAVLDEEKIQGDILLRIGKDEPYEGIGRGQLNIENIPVYCDEVGPFGSPTSDTLRTAISDKTKEVLLFIISFNGTNHLEEDINLCKNLYETYADAKGFSSKII